MTTPRTILILGAGLGGTAFAQRLRKRLPKPHRVVLIEREAHHLYQPSLLWLATGRREASSIQRPVRHQSQRGIEVITGSVERIDPERRTVTVNGQEWAGDYLVIALGAELAPGAISGLEESGYNLYTVAGAEALARALDRFKGGRLVLLIASIPFRCPAAPYEAAMLLDAKLTQRGERHNTEIAIYTPEPGPMPVAGPEVSAQVRMLVEAKGIDYHTGEAVVQVVAQARCIEFASGEKAEFDLLVFVPPHRAPQVVVEAGLTGESGWVPVDRHTLQTRFSKVFAIGDVTGIPLAHGKPLPKAGVFAAGEAEVVARNIAHDITGGGEIASFEGEGECFVETGHGLAGFGSGNFYAEPAPQVALHAPSRWQCWRKLALEKYWLWLRF